MGEAVGRVLDGGTLDRREGLALVAQPVDGFAPAAELIPGFSGLAAVSSNESTRVPERVVFVDGYG